MHKLLEIWNRLTLIEQIIVGLVIGIILGIVAPKAAAISIMGTLFVTALKSVAPILVLFLIMNAICHHKQGQQTNMKDIIILYLLGTFLAGCIAVVMSFIFRIKLVLAESAADINPPSGLTAVMKQLLTNLVANPVDALINANYLGILVWAILLGVALRFAKGPTKDVIGDISDAISMIVRWVIKFAPLGVLGLVFAAISTNGIGVLATYGKLIILLVSAMVIDALVMNPIIVFTQIRQNPYPLVLRCLKDSGITAFFTRSSAANIPVNMRLCEDLGLDKDTYAISIPLGATINMGGASITISILSLAACHTMGVHVSLPLAIILCVLAAASACGASGVPGGSLLLIPLACSLFGISSDISAQVIGVGFIVAVIQDSCETMINSSTDVLFTATAELKKRKKAGEDIHVSIFDKKEDVA
jgi:serine/threonine transporter